MALAKAPGTIRRTRWPLRQPIETGAPGSAGDCAPTEKLFFLDWLANRIVELQKENRGDEAKVMAGVKELLSYLDVPEEGQSNPTPLNRSEQVIKAAGGTSDGVLNLLRDMEPLYQRLAVILALPH